MNYLRCCSAYAGRASPSALHELEGRGLIRSLRGRIRIVDRLGLQLAASGFYGIPECQYERSIGFASGKRSLPSPCASSKAEAYGARLEPPAEPRNFMGVVPVQRLKARTSAGASV